MHVNSVPPPFAREAAACAFGNTNRLPFSSTGFFDIGLRVSRLGLWRPILVGVLVCCLLPGMHGQRNAASRGANVSLAVISPAAGSVLPGSSATFTWTTNSSVSQYQLWLGTTGVGSENLGAYTFGSTRAATESKTVSGLPATGAILYVRLLWGVNGGWASSDSTYLEANTAAVGVSAVSCGSASLNGAGSDACSVTLSAAANSAEKVSLASNNSAVKVPSSVTVAAGASSAAFTATATAVGTAQTATLTAIAGGTSQTYALQLNATAPALSLSATSVAFGTEPLNQVATKAVMLTSSGTAPLTIYAVMTGGSGFSWQGLGSTPLTLAPGQSATLVITFDPNSASAFSGTATIVDNTPSDTTIPLSGAGQSASPAVAAPSAVSCSSATLTGAGTDACTVMLSSAATNTTIVSLMSSNSAVTVPPSVTVTGGASTVGFMATASAVSTAQTATLTATAGGASTTYALQLNPAIPAMSLSTANMAFGNVLINTPTSQTVTVTSSGTAQLILSSATATGAGFSVSGVSAPITLNPGQTTALTIGFDPASTGAMSGTVTIGSNASSAPTIALSGTGEPGATLSAVSCSSASLTGAATDACTATLTSAASSPVTVSLGSSNSAVTAPASVTIAAGASSAGFTATATAVTTAQTATLTATAAGVSVTYPLQLNAATAALGVSSSNVAFGNVTENTMATQPVILTASGTAPLTVSAGSVSGMGFSVSGITFPITLNPSQTATLNLLFTPTTLSSATGTVTLTSNATSGGTTSISLSGTGIAQAYQVDLSWNAPTASTDPVAGYNVYRATGNGTFAVMNSSPISQPSWTDTTVQNGAAYSYQITSVDASGIESTPSSPSSVSIP